MWMEAEGGVDSNVEGTEEEEMGVMGIVKSLRG